ncbi:unnamed protein product [Ilex paraguariensis]|uniref:Uncharacterized protein n=1 Tax=Ilex paraguariensis TaxID=185542 RepID=A0ABC8TB48_9AQUA
MLCLQRWYPQLTVGFLCGGSSVLALLTALGPGSLVDGPKDGNLAHIPVAITTSYCPYIVVNSPDRYSYN